MKQFIFTWHKNEKYGPQIERQSTIKSTDAESAMQSFISVNGNLNKNTVSSIQEIDRKGNPVGEPITPMAEETSRRQLLKQILANKIIEREDVKEEILKAE